MTINRRGANVILTSAIKFEQEVMEAQEGVANAAGSLRSHVKAKGLANTAGSLRSQPATE